MSLSRSGSPSKGFVPLVHLDNLETLQDRWAKQAADSRHPAAAPTLNSPRSLRACELCGCDPDRDLAKYSLKQHLSWVLGDPRVEAQVAAMAERVESKAAMQVAVLAFQRAAIGIGTAKEKLVAYETFQRQEQQRVPRLSTAREMRRQLMAEEVYDRRRRAYAESSGERSNMSASRGSGSSAGKRKESALWSTSAPAAAAERRSARNSRQSSREVSAPVTPTASATIAGRGGGLSARHRSASGPARSVSPTSAGHSLNDFTPPLISDGYLPYVPRNAESLNTNFFGNRAFDGPVSNPSRTPLVQSMTEHSENQPLRRPSTGGSLGAGENQDHTKRPNQLVDDSLMTKEDDPMSGRRRHSKGPKASDYPAHKVQEDPVNDSVSVEHISPGGKNDLSIASISSSQLGRMLGSPDPRVTGPPPKVPLSSPFGNAKTIKKAPLATTAVVEAEKKRQPDATMAQSKAAAPVNMFYQKQAPRTAPPMPSSSANNTTSTPPRMVGLANLKAIIEEKKKHKDAQNLSVAKGRAKRENEGSMAVAHAASSFSTPLPPSQVPRAVPTPPLSSAQERHTAPSAATTAVSTEDKRHRAALAPQQPQPPNPTEVTRPRKPQTTPEAVIPVSPPLAEQRVAVPVNLFPDPRLSKDDQGKASEDEGIFFIFCANPAPLCRV